MLTIEGQKTGRFCDGVTRRDFLKIGGLAMGGLSMAQILRAESVSGIRKSPKSVIMIYMAGAPPHQDIFDLKMDAPLEVRGPFRPSATNVAGIQISEHMPYCAKIMDKLVPIRSMVGSLSGDHDSHICYTGRSARGVPIPPGGWPSIGSVMTKLCAANGRDIPKFVGLAPNAGHPLDVFDQQAFDVLTSSKLVDALDISKEDPKTRERYGKGDAKNYGDGAPRNNEHFLVARRLVEAGARCVTMNFGRWDFHSNNHSELLTHLPLFDQGLSALVEDLHQHGMDKDVAVVAWGEFGRTPTINKDAGRDHWPNVGCAVVAGGGFKTGHVIGATDRLGGEATERPVHFGEVFATLYHWLGIDLNNTTLPDLSGRPQYLVDGWQPIKELI